jgi:uncharacterized protein (TIGR01244 family)
MLSFMQRIVQRSLVALAALALMVVCMDAQQVTKRQIEGVSTFAQLDTTIACGGATRPEAIPELGKMGFKSVINLRLAGEEGAQVEQEGEAVRAAGMRYVHLPFNVQTPDPKLVDDFIAAVTLPANQPAYVHCAAGGRAAAMWMIKRVVADHWDEPRALTEANALGLNDRLRPFALNYIHTHAR